MSSRSRPAAVLVLLGSVAAAAPQAEDDGSGWAPARLDLVVSVVPSVPEVLYEGVLVLRLEAERSSGPSIGIRQDLFAALDVLEAEGAERSDEPYDPAYRVASWARLRFAEPRSRGDEVEVWFAYAGRGSADQIVVADDVAFASWVEGWYPAPRPVDPASATSSLRAPGTTTFHLPPGWRSVSNGCRVRSDAGADEVVEAWECDPPVARSFVAGPYQEARHLFGPREIGVYLLSPKPTSAESQARILGRALDVMESRFGPYPYPTYSIAEVPLGRGDFGASSEQGFIMAKPNFFAVEGGNLPLFAHEAAHGWWGNLVGQRGPGSILCSESLAQYGAVLAIEGLEGEEAATEFLRFSRPGYIGNQCARGYFELLRAGNDRPLSQLEGGGWEHTLADAKGHWVLHMLRRRVGDEVFFGTLRDLVVRHGGSRMSLDDLRGAFLAAQPEGAELERFFAQWLDRGGAPVLELEWHPLDDGSGIEVVLRQVQEQEPFQLDVELSLDLPGDAGGQARLENVRVDEREARLTIEGPVPSDVRLDPAHRLLIWKPEYGPPPGT